MRPIKLILSILLATILNELMKEKIIGLCFFIGITTCQAQPIKMDAKLSRRPIVLNLDNKVQKEKITKLNLDSLYTNLLDANHPNDSVYAEVRNSWAGFHQKVIKYIEKEKFHWDVSDSTIKIFHRIYFDKGGTVDYYLFSIKNPSISARKKKEYRKVLIKFSKEIKLDLLQTNRYAQCGRTTYINY